MNKLTVIVVRLIFTGISEIKNLPLSKFSDKPVHFQTFNSLPGLSKESLGLWLSSKNPVKEYFFI